MIFTGTRLFVHFTPLFWLSVRLNVIWSEINKHTHKHTSIYTVYIIITQRLKKILAYSNRLTCKGTLSASDGYQYKGNNCYIIEVIQLAGILLYIYINNHSDKVSEKHKTRNLS